MNRSSQLRQQSPIGIDTNILVRYVMQDDQPQFARAVALLASLSDDRPGYLTLVTLAELFWVLDRVYRMNRTSISDVVFELIATEGIRLQDEASVIEALDTFSNSNVVDFSDCLICLSARSAGCDITYTFDKSAARVSGMTLLA